MKCAGKEEVQKSTSTNFSTEYTKFLTTFPNCNHDKSSNSRTRNKTHRFFASAKTVSISQFNYIFASLPFFVVIDKKYIFHPKTDKVKNNIFAAITTLSDASESLSHEIIILFEVKRYSGPSNKTIIHQITEFPSHMLTSCSTLFSVVQSCTHTHTRTRSSCIMSIVAHMLDTSTSDMSKWRLRQTLIFTLPRGIRVHLNSLALSVSLSLSFSVASNLIRLLLFPYLHRSRTRSGKWKKCQFNFVP